MKITQLLNKFKYSHNTTTDTILTTNTQYNTLLAYITKDLYTMETTIAIYDIQSYYPHSEIENIDMILCIDEVLRLPDIMMRVDKDKRRFGGIVVLFVEKDVYDSCVYGKRTKRILFNKDLIIFEDIKTKNSKEFKYLNIINY